MITVLEDTRKLELILKDSDKKEEIILFFEELLNKKIKDYNYISIETFNSIIEYDFSLVEVEIFFLTGEKKTIYIRMIKGGMIKESIFCYWSLLYKKYSDYSRNQVPHKVSITEKTIQENKKSIVLTIDKDMNYYTEICLVEMKKFLEQRTKGNKKFKGVAECFYNNDKDILFLGII